MAVLIMPLRTTSTYYLCLLPLRTTSTYYLYVLPLLTRSLLDVGPLLGVEVHELLNQVDRLGYIRLQAGMHTVAGWDARGDSRSTRVTAWSRTVTAWSHTVTAWGSTATDPSA